MKKILVPIDFSECASNALLYAVEVAKKIDGEILLFHVCQETAEPISAPIINLTPLLIETAEKKLAELKTNGVKRKQQVVCGLVKESILSVIEEEQIDLVIMGTTGASTLTKKLLGTVTSGLIKKVNVPLLAIPNGAVYDEKDGVFMALDFNDQSIPNVSIVKGLMGEKEEIRVYFSQTKKNEVDIQKQINELKKQLNGCVVNYSITHDTEVSKAINKRSSGLKSRMIVTFNKKYSFIKGLFHASVSESIVKNGQTPVLVLKA